MNKGFTLVELSIVLVIIGLLIGGILVAQSMIGTTKVQAQIRQIQQFDAAVNNFITKYSSIPGDSTKMTPRGDGSGTVWDEPSFETSAQLFSIWYFRNEVANFWVHLSNSGFTQDGATFTATIPATGLTVTGSPRNIPASTINPKAGLVVGTTTTFGSFANTWKAVYQIADFSGVTSTASYLQSSSLPAISPIQALAIDSKIDDSQSRSGIVQANKPGPDASGYFANSNASDVGLCFSGNTYRTTNDTVCSVTVEVLAQTGGLSRKCRPAMVCP